MLADAAAVTEIAVAGPASEYSATDSLMLLTVPVPTAAERTGDFSDILGGYIPGGTNYNGQSVLLDPCTGLPAQYNQSSVMATYYCEY